MIKTFTLPNDSAKHVADALKFHSNGLIPAIAMQHDTQELLMQAWMNKESVIETLVTGRVCYFSRSKSALWRKGEISGHTQQLVHFRMDCDKDCVQLLVDQTGAACHTMRRNCFFYEPLPDGNLSIIHDPIA